MLGAVADVRGAVGRVVETVGLAPGGHGGVPSPGARGHAALLGRALALVYYIIIIVIHIIILIPHYLRHHRHAVVLAGAHVARAVGEGGGGEAVLLAPPGYHHLYSLDLVIICNVITCRCPCSRSRAPWRDTCPRLPQLRWWWRGPPWWGRAAPRCWRRAPGRWWWSRCCFRCCRHLVKIILLILQSFFTVGNSFRMFQCPTYNGDVCTRLERLHGSTGAVTGAPVAAVPAGQRGQWSRDTAQPMTAHL